MRVDGTLVFALAVLVNHIESRPMWPSRRNIAGSTSSSTSSSTHGSTSSSTFGSTSDSSSDSIFGRLHTSAMSVVPENAILLANVKVKDSIFYKEGTTLHQIIGDAYFLKRGGSIIGFSYGFAPQPIRAMCDYQGHAFTYTISTEHRQIIFDDEFEKLGIKGIMPTAPKRKNLPIDQHRAQIEKNDGFKVIKME